MNTKQDKSCLGIYEHHPLVSLYLKGSNKEVPFWEDSESELIFTVHKDYLPSIVAKLKETMRNN